MKWLALLGLGGLASAGPRHAPDKYATAASTEFEQAITDEQRGRLDDALGHYKNAFQISPHPDVIFNEASLLERLDREHEAITAYELYLVLAPDAPDRAQVEAAIQRITARSRTFPLTSNLELDDAYVLLDGAIVAKPGQIKDHATEITIGPGYHFVVIVTAISFAAEEITAHSIVHDRSNKVYLHGAPRSDGNVLVEMPYMYHALIEHTEIYETKRVAVTPGVQTLAVHSGSYECPPIKVEAPRDGVELVQLLEDELPEIKSEGVLGRCRKRIIKQQHLVFAK